MTSARILAAEFGRNRHESARRRPLHRAATFDGTGEIDEIESAGLQQRLGRVVVQKDVGEDVFGHARLVKRAGQPLAREQGLRRVFQHHRVARDQRGATVLIAVM